MRHPEVLLIPVLLLSDYFLTLWGARAAEEKYRLHFRTEHYEMNPLWQESVAKRKWLNPRHLALVAIISVLFYVLVSLPWIEETSLNFVIGVYFGVFGAVMGRHLSNLSVFLRFKKEPDAVRGEVHMTHPLVLSIAQANYLGALFPLALLALFVRHPMVIGAACGVAMLYVVHGIWRAKARKAAQRARAAVAQQARAGNSGA